MKIILAAMATVIVILVVALGASLMGKPDVVVREVPERVVPNPRPAYTGNEDRQRQSQNQQEADRLRREAQRSKSEADRLRYEAEREARERSGRI